MLYRLSLAERLGRTLGELDATMGGWELQLWAARDEIDGLVEDRMNRTRGLRYSDALDLVRADYRAHLARKVV